MSRKFLPIFFYGLFVTIVIPGISHALNETIESGNMKDMFRAPFKLAGSGDMWAENDGYVETCTQGGDFGFITKQINIKDVFADVIYVAMETSFSLDNKYNNSLGIYLRNGTAQPPSTTQSVSKEFFLQNFSLIYTVENNTASARNGVKWTHIFKFNKNGSNNIILAVRGIGVCARVYSMKFYYYYCGENYFKGLRFPKTVSPFEGWKKVEANCSLNSSPSDQRRTLSGFCGYHGTWNISRDMGCFCKKGFQQNSLKQCIPCPSDHFKPTSSNESCQICPDKSTNTVDRTSCECMKGYYHSTLKADPTTAPCFGPIGEKLKMSIKKLSDKTVKVTWNAAKVEEEIRNSLRYDVQCFMCEGRKCSMTCGNVRYKPRQDNLTKTFVEISNLHPGHPYKFRVYPKTVINRFLEKANWSYTETELFLLPVAGVPSPVRDIIFIDKTETSITLLWKPPLDQDVQYDIKCNKCPSGSDSGPCEVPCGRLVTFKPSQNNLTYTNVTIHGLDPNTEYEFVFYSKNYNSVRINGSNWARAVKKIKTEALITGISKSDDLHIAVVIVVSVVVTIIMMIVIIFMISLFKRRKTRQFRANLRLSGGDFSLLYVDPTTYDNPERAVSEFARELDRNLIKFEAIIGGGEFGDVYKGEMKLPEQPATKVAIKTLKPGASHKNRTDFLIEASVMGQFKNLNVITLEGVVTKGTPLLIVTEFMENGSLNKYLKENDGMLNPLQLLGMARGVASGMEYLAGMHFVHRDLAARNVLVNDNLACKVADFGLSRDLDYTEDLEYESQGGKIPVRWTAPEAITYLKFSTASDIWSYGILLWEIMSFAERPYRNWRNGELVIWVNQGYRLPPPMNCPKTVHELMKECWMTDRTKRPPFKEIVRIIDEWIKYPEKLNEDHINVRRTEPLDSSTFTSVKDWLEAIEMGMYASNFSQAGYEELSDVAQLTEDELLKKVGVRLVGHRCKIYQRIKEMSEDMKLKREQPVGI